jgi:hypothetical protein
MAVALATISAWLAACWVLKFGTIGVFDMDAQLVFPILYGESIGNSIVLSFELREVFVCMLLVAISCCGSGDRKPLIVDV